MQWTVNNLDKFESATNELFNEILGRKQTTGATVVCLQGDLGAGKTTMTQIIARLLGVIDTVVSPTFVIKKTYTTQGGIFTKLVHMDAYRLEGEHLDTLRLSDDFAQNDTLMIIEWPEIIESILPVDAIRVTINHVDSGRIIILESNKKNA
jgi:tRNA threonylcarbamoyladenosine biosynthesis protein TsaE